MSPSFHLPLTEYLPLNSGPKKTYCQSQNYNKSRQLSGNYWNYVCPGNWTRTRYENSMSLQKQDFKYAEKKLTLLLKRICR
jgi:hypothetical protein